MIKIIDQDLKHTLIDTYIQRQIPIEEVTLFGIENSLYQDRDVINDVIGIYYKNKDLYLMEGTTNAGKFYTDNPMNSVGCFHLGYGYHKKIWKVGLHTNYEALVNQKGCGNVTGWRDKDKNHMFDENIDKFDAGVFAVDLHHMGTKDRTTIGRNSAGCQVLHNYADFAFLMSLVKRSDMYIMKSDITYFSYTLFRKPEMEDLYNEVYKK